MSEPKMDENTDGSAFDNFFESLGEKTEHLMHKDLAVESKPSININNSKEPTTQTISTDTGNDQRVVDEIESLCMNCHENGTTRLLLTRIPFFREIIIMSFECPHCNFKNSEIQSAGEIQQRGCKYELRLTSPPDFARQTVKSDTCMVKFIELDVEIPPGRGQLTNIEGLLTMILEDLEILQSERKKQAPEVYEKVEEVLARGRKMLAGESFPFRLLLDDPAGNSWIEPNQKDGVGKWSRIEYARTPEQNEALGLVDSTNIEGATAGEAGNEPNGSSVIYDDDIVPNEVYSFPTACPGCTRHCTTHMKMVEIPNFKQVVIMSMACDNCGYRSSEVKTGGEVPEKGKKVILNVERPEDLNRDILKSESCTLECPELRLSVNPGTLGGRFTTVEGLLTQVRRDLHQQIFDVGDEVGAGGDSLPPDIKENWKKFFEDIDAAIKGDMTFTLVLTDPLASSYVQNLCLPEEDPQITSVDYERTEEEEEDLGLRDMKTEGYEADASMP